MKESKRYEIINKLGEGAYGCVFKAIDHKWDPKSSAVKMSIGGKREIVEAEERKEEVHYVALKMIKPKQKQDGIDFTALREIKFLQEIDHINMIKLQDVFFKNQNIYLSLEFMYTDLDKLIKDKNILLTEGIIKGIMLQVVEGLRFLHGNWIMHRDLNPSNLLINEEGIIKFTDFGMARLYGSPDRQLSNGVVTMNYRSPEVIFGSMFYGPSLDIWSLGCIFGELMLRELLFPGIDAIDQMARICSLRGTPDEDNWPGVSSLPAYMPFVSQSPFPLSEIFTAASPESLDLIDQLLELDPNKRPKAEDILKHKYFSSEPKPVLPKDIPVPQQQVKMDRLVNKVLSNRIKYWSRFKYLCKIKRPK